MVSNARLDLPEPESPVTTMRRSRGISSEMFFRLWTRAPCTAIVVRGSDTRGFAELLEGIGRILDVKEGQLLHLDMALLREMHRHGRLADQPAIGQVFARRGHAAHVEVAVEVCLELVARS